MKMKIPGTEIYVRPIPASLLKFPPAPEPETLPSPSHPHSLSHPFTISPSAYNAALSPSVPITIALVYAVSVVLLNQYNKKRGNKPWAISKTRPFFLFVLAHNIFLAVYSAWTFIGISQGLRASIPSPRGPDGLTGTVDGLCKLHGPRGLGSAAVWSPTKGEWHFTNRNLHLSANGTPDETDVGRLWNEALAFYGWLFYLSKFYEVFDTLIILAKGKRSSTLQTYHHTGAMLCMWAGIRYMAPAIWMFVCINSLIHSLMYTYYALTALSVKVPLAVKRTLTTMQILQFVFGVTFAYAHLLIAYEIPVSMPYIFSTADLTSIPADAASTVSSAVAAASAGVGSWAKKLALRAAGMEGAAENVENESGQLFGVDAIHAAQDLKAREEIRYRDERHLVHCTDTSGQTFAVLLNCFYLVPLTFLFVRFFVRSYMARVRRNSISSSSHITNEARKDATKGVDRSINDELGPVHDSEEPTVSPAEDAKSKLKDLKKEIDSSKEGVKSTLQDIKMQSKS